MCEVCDAPEWKYKCPKCVIKYCSVSCFKSHNCSPTIKEDKPPTSQRKRPLQFDSDDETDILITDQLQSLNCPKIRKILSNIHLRNILKEIDSSKQPEVALEHYSDEPIVLEFFKACLDTVPCDNTAT